MSEREFQTWMIRYRIEPFGEARDDMRAGNIASPIVNMLMRSIWKDPERYTKPSEWVIDYFKKAAIPGMQSGAEIKVFFKNLTLEMQREAEVKRKREAAKVARKPHG